MIAEPSSRRRMFAADACWPGSGRAAWIAGWKLVRDPCSASSESAHARSAVRARRRRAHEAERRHRGHELRAVDQREPFLRLQPNRLEADGCERLGAAEQLAVDPRLALPDERQREMRERREVAAGADRATRRDVRQHPAVEALDQELDGLDPSAGIPLRERVRAQQHRRADDLVRIRLTDAARVAAQQPKLELLDLLVRDRLRHEPAEPRVDAVRVLAVNGPLDELARGLHLRARASLRARLASRARRRPTRPRAGGRPPSAPDLSARAESSSALSAGLFG